MKSNELQPGKTYRVPVQFAEAYVTEGYLTVTIPAAWPTDEILADLDLTELLESQREENADNGAKNDGIEDVERFDSDVQIRVSDVLGSEIEEALVFCPHCGVDGVPVPHDCKEA